jgi:hypothetical protein
MTKSDSALELLRIAYSACNQRGECVSPLGARLYEDNFVGAMALEVTCERCCVAY